MTADTLDSPRHLPSEKLVPRSHRFKLPNQQIPAFPVSPVALQNSKMRAGLRWLQGPCKFLARVVFEFLRFHTRPQLKFSNRKHRTRGWCGGFYAPDQNNRSGTRLRRRLRWRLDCDAWFSRGNQVRHSNLMMWTTAQSVHGDSETNRLRLGQSKVPELFFFFAFLPFRANRIP